MSVKTSIRHVGQRTLTRARELRFLRSSQSETRRVRAEFEKAIGRQISPLSTRDRKRLFEQPWLRDRQPRLSQAYIEWVRHASGVDDATPIPHHIFFGSVLPLLNDSSMTKAYADKRRLPELFGSNTIPVLFSWSHGDYWRKGAVVSRDSARKILADLPGGYVVKSATGSLQGLGVAIHDTPPTSAEHLDWLDRPMGPFVVQPRVAQSRFTEQFNPTSLNCIRISTLRRPGGEVQVVGATLKFGDKGDTVDSLAGGGYYIPIAPDGQLGDSVFEKSGARQPLTALGFGPVNRAVPGFSEALSVCREGANMFPYHRYIGWDIALDTKDAPIIVEANIAGPGVCRGNVMHGSMFDEETKGFLLGLLRESPNAR